MRTRMSATTRNVLSDIVTGIPRRARRRILRTLAARVSAVRSIRDVLFARASEFILSLVQRERLGRSGNQCVYGSHVLGR